MIDANPQPSPMVSSPKLTTDGTSGFDDPTLYRQIVGALQYLTFTRLKLTYVVNKISQYMYSPQLHHWKAVKRILRYISDARSYGL